MLKKTEKKDFVYLKYHNYWYESRMTCAKIDSALLHTLEMSGTYRVSFRLIHWSLIGGHR